MVLETIINTSIVGVAVLITIGLLLWYCNKQNLQSPNRNYETDIETSRSTTQHSDIETCKKAASFGEMQSPINIISTTNCGKTKVMRDEEFITNPLRFCYPSKITNCTILNNGHTVQINIASHNKCELYINNKIYSLKQFHFHTPSEHLIDSHKFEMEMHLVHINQQNEIAVLGFIFTTKQKRFQPKLSYTKSKKHLVLSNEKKRINKLSNLPESDDDFKSDEDWEDSDAEQSDAKQNEQKGNDFLEQFWDELPQKKTEGEIALNNALSFDYLFETASNNFKKKIETNEMEIDMELFEYTGSLTTPPYTEGVQWLVSKTTHFINSKQLYKLSGCWGHENNARDIQDYFGRTVSVRNKSQYDVVGDT